MAPARVTLFVPCLVDQVLPGIAHATLALLEHLGYRVDYDPRAVCCGQVAYNAGQCCEARRVAGCLVEVLGASEGPIVCPSGSCASMVRREYPELFRGEREERAARELGPRVRELSEFLSQSGAAGRIRGAWRGRVAWHLSCHARRGLGLEREAESFLERIEGLELVEAAGEATCCGFGGLFSAEFPAISSAMAASRLEGFVEAGAEVVVTGDPGCLLTLRAEARERGWPIEVLHLAELLAEATGALERRGAAAPGDAASRPATGRRS